MPYWPSISSLSSKFSSNEKQDLRSILQNVDNDELYVHFVHQMLMGIIQKPSLRSYFSKNPILNSPVFYSTMAEYRYETINRFLHSVDNSQLEHMKATKSGSKSILW